MKANILVANREITAYYTLALGRKAQCAHCRQVGRRRIVSLVRDGSFDAGPGEMSATDLEVLMAKAEMKLQFVLLHQTPQCEREECLKSLEARVDRRSKEVKAEVDEVFPV